jgi:hypothetical protein
VQRQWRISQRESSQNALMRRCRLTYMYVPSQVRLYLTFGTGKKTGGAGTHKRHTGHAHGRTPWHTDHTDEPHNHVPSKPTNTPARYSATTGTGLAARPLPVT